MARNRLGGRIWTDRSLGYPMDMGAMWIEGTEGNPLAEQARKLGVRTVPDPDKWLYVDADGTRLDEEKEDAWNDSMTRRLRKLAAGLDRDISAAEALRRVLSQKERTDPFEQRRSQHVRVRRRDDVRRPGGPDFVSLLQTTAVTMGRSS